MPPENWTRRWPEAPHQTRIQDGRLQGSRPFFCRHPTIHRKGFSIPSGMFSGLSLSENIRVGVCKPRPAKRAQVDGHAGGPGVRCQFAASGAERVLRPGRQGGAVRARLHPRLGQADDARPLRRELALSKTVAAARVAAAATQVPAAGAAARRAMWCASHLSPEPTHTT